MRRLLAAATLAMGATPAGAVSLSLPSPAEVTGSHSQINGSYDLPTGPWHNGAIPFITVEGGVQQTAWRLAGRDLSTMDLVSLLRGQLTKAGFSILYECETNACGGFDFRYGTQVLPEPQMHIDLGDYRFLSAKRDGTDGEDYVSVIASRSSQAGFVQIIQAGKGLADDLRDTPPPDTAKPPSDAPVPASQSAVQKPDATAASPSAETSATIGDPSDFASQLETGGTVALDDLSFDSGSSALEPGTYGSLTQLAEYLKSHPNATVALVGHTDTSGSLDANIMLSKKRATSVLDTLVKSYGVSKAQLDAEGVGYLAPRATNLTEAGRTKNRRVEVMLTSTQ